MPVRRYFTICVGMIGIRAKDFWEMSPIEIYMALEGFVEFNGGEQDKPLTNQELEDLMELYPD